MDRTPRPDSIEGRNEQTLFLEIDGVIGNLRAAVAEPRDFLDRASHPSFRARRGALRLTVANNKALTHHLETRYRERSRMPSLVLEVPSPTTPDSALEVRLEAPYVTGLERGLDADPEAGFSVVYERLVVA